MWGWGWISRLDGLTAYGGFRACPRCRRTQYNAHGYRVAYRPRYRTSMCGSPPPGIRPGSVFSGVCATPTVALATCRHLGLVVLGLVLDLGMGGFTAHRWQRSPFHRLTLFTPISLPWGWMPLGCTASTVPSSVFPLCVAWLRFARAFQPTCVSALIAITPRMRIAPIKHWHSTFRYYLTVTAYL